MKIIKEENGYRLFKNHRREPYFTFVKNGIKTIEGRLKKEAYSEIKSGDSVIVMNEQETDSFVVTVRSVKYYGSFKEMLEHENIERVLPDAKSIEEGVMIYRQFYSKEQESQYGVVALEVSVM